LLAPLTGGSVSDPDSASRFRDSLRGGNSGGGGGGRFDGPGTFLVEFAQILSFLVNEITIFDVLKSLFRQFCTFIAPKSDLRYNFSMILLFSCTYLYF
jgi:hypothetical protein